MSALSDAINAIPLDTKRERLRAATQFLLVRLANRMNNARHNINVGVVCDNDAIGFYEGFVPAWKWEEVWDAYMDELHASAPLTDIFYHLHVEMYDGKSKDLAQHFTPSNLVSASVDCLDVDEFEGDICNIGDPCCGSGGFLLEVIKRLHNRGIPANVLANDKDHLCAAMTALQILANVYYHRIVIDVMTVFRADAITEYFTAPPCLTYGPLKSVNHPLQRFVRKVDLALDLADTHQLRPI